MIRYGLFIALMLALGYVCYDLGQRGARAYERMQLQRIENALAALGITWATARADGLQIELVGHAPDLFAQELALETARATAAMSEVSNYTTASLSPPEHRDPVHIELLRDQRGITLTGQTASRDMRDSLGEYLGRDAPGLEVRDLTGIQAAAPPRSWGPEMAVASLAASRLGDAYIVIEPGFVSVEGAVADVAAREALTDELLARAGASLPLALKLKIPPGLVAPFAFSATKDPGGGIRLERCTARNLTEQSEIVGALQLAGIEQRADPCPIGLGGPSGAWADAVRAALTALADIPAGRVDLEYHDLHLTAAPPSTPAVVDAAMDALRERTPEGFVATGALESDDEVSLADIRRDSYWLQISHGTDGLLLSGKVPDGMARSAIEIYAAARFGQARVRSALVESTDPAPAGWEVGALRVLDHLQATERADVRFAGHHLDFRAHVSAPAAAGTLHRGLQTDLPAFDISTHIHIDLPEAVAAVPLPAQPCSVALERLVNANPVEFDPGSAVITAGSARVLDRLTAQFRRCKADPIEVGGHTDSQGSEDLNLRISKARANAVRTALINRGIAHYRLTSRGYGESEPIADNSTEAGRARNRRITFAPAPPSPSDPKAED